MGAPSLQSSFFSVHLCDFFTPKMSATYLSPNSNLCLLNSLRLLFPAWGPPSKIYTLYFDERGTCATVQKVPTGRNLGWSWGLPHLIPSSKELESYDASCPISKQIWFMYFVQFLNSLWWEAKSTTNFSLSMQVEIQKIIYLFENGR